MTEKLYDRDAYLARFTATVLSCEKRGNAYAVILDKTAFFPEGGGQFGDVGTLDGVAVTDTQTEGDLILHTTHAPLEIGKTVVGEVDFATRFDRMQNHSAEHIVSGLVHRLFGLDNVGFHLGNEETTLDFNGVLDRADLDRVEDLANEAIFCNLPITVSYPTADELAALDYRSKKELTGEVRIVTVEGYDICACCAPHVARTGEIGLVKLLDFIHYKGGVRIRLLAGARALRDYRLKFREIAAISRACAVPQEEAAAGVDRLLAELSERKQAAAELLRENVSLRAATLTPNAAGNILTVITSSDPIALRNTALAAAPRAPQGAAVALFGNDAEGYRFAIAAEALPLRALARTLTAALGGRGGGTDLLIQGVFSAPLAAVTACFEKPLT